MKDNIYQIKITLKNSKPAIWRRILIEPNTLLSDFHKIIQTTMGWTNCHLHRFYKKNIYYSPEDLDYVPSLIESLLYQYINYKTKRIRVNQLLMFEKDQIMYEYDFGDNWEHEILLEKIIPRNPKIKYPICTGGKRNCPPEDTGGIYRYKEVLKIIRQPDHEEYESILEWMGTSFDPEYFDKEEINEMLGFKNFGCP